MSLSPISDALAALRAGTPVIVIDDELRDSEGSVVLAAETATGAGAAIGIPTLIAAGAVAVTSKAVDIGNQAVDQAVAPMDGSN